MGFFDKLFGGSSAKQTAPVRPEALSVATAAGTVYAPIAGRVEVTDAIPDPVFAQEMMGKTVAIWPSDGTVYAPVSGTVVSAMPHAIGLAGDDGVEVLIHVGIDTVMLNGEGLSAFAKQGDRVRAGQPVIEFDSALMAEHGIDMTVATVLLDAPDKHVEQPALGSQVTRGADVVVAYR